MKWGDSPELASMLGNGPIPHDEDQQQQGMDMGRPMMARSQDDATVGYFFQRRTDPDFEYGKNVRWALGDDSIIAAKKAEGPEYEDYRALPPLGHHGQPIEIAPAAKKLWGVGDQKEDPKGIFNLAEQPWRDTAWSTGHPSGMGDHAVSQPITMVQRRSGSYPGSDVNNVLSPRSSETSGLGVKMVEYVLGTSPTTKDHLDARMGRLSLVNAGDGDKDKDKAPSPFDPSKKDVENGNPPQANGIVQNGLCEDDKAFNRTPGSRQPSPAEEDMNKNKAEDLGVVVGNGVGGQPGLNLDSNHFEPVIIDPSMAFENSYNLIPPMDSPNILPQANFDTQQHQLFRNNQQQQPTPPQIQLLTQQQYLAAQQQGQLPGLPTPATFSAPYVINAQEPYLGTLIAGPTVLPGYYGVPWGVYPANIIQQGNQPRRPLTPSGTSSEGPTPNGNSNLTQGQLGQYQVIPAYYDQNGSLIMGNLRGVGNGTPVRLVSPAPVIINSGNPAANNVRLLGNGGPQVGTPPSLYNGNQSTSLYPTPTSQGSNGNGEQNSSRNSLSTLQTSSSLASSFASLGYGNSSLSSLGSTALGGLGGGLNSNSSSNRRDSFDRASSAFSPSLDYRSAKWPQNYGALGTVTASPGPLGLTSGGSLTPPPSLTGSSSSLQLGALMSAAPGAETKYRNGSLTNGGMFGASLFHQLKRGASLEKPGGRSRLLEDFRNNRYPNLQLRDLTNHIVEFSSDQHGSRFIQQKLERATPSEKQMVFSEILSATYNLMTDVFGNYVIQKFFEFGTPDQKSALVQKVRGHALPLALQMYGCRVIQKALESIPADQQIEIVRELDGHVLKCVKDQNGNHVVQKCIECVDPFSLQFIVDAFRGQVFALSTHPYGCRVIQRILEHCTSEQTAPILEELHQHTEQLIQDQYGNYVIQHVLEHGQAEDKSKIVAMSRGKVLQLSQHKFASNVIEKCVQYSSRAERAVLVEEICSYNDGPHSALHTMMKDQYANYVVQKMLDMAEPTQRKILMHKIRPHVATLRKYTYGKHILAKLEKYLVKNPGDLGPIGPPTNGL